MEQEEVQKPAESREEGKEEASNASSALLDEVLEGSRRHRHPVETFPLPRPQPWSRVGNGRQIVR